MKKNNRKGFTLIELLAVIVILITISAIAIPSITASIERSKAKQREAKIEIIIEAAKLYYSSHRAKINSDPCYIPINKLELTDKELENPQGGTFDGVVVYNNNKFLYASTSNNITECVQ